MIETVTSAQMRAIEAEAIASGVVTGAELMERAGAGAVAVMLAHWPDLSAGGARAVVLCGPGNNGGDGFVVARLLAARGWPVAVHSADRADLIAHRFRAGDAGAMARAWMAAAGDARPMEAAALAASLGQAGPVVLVDALLGIGQNRPADAILAPLNAALDAGPWPPLRRLAIDIPTGIDADSGAALAARPFQADLTVTFHAPKPAHAVQPLCGRVAVVDIGLPSGSC